MSIVDKVTQVNAAVQAFVQTGLDTTASYHQAAVEVPVDLARSLGLDKSNADVIRNAHQRMVTNLYGAVGSVNKQLGDLFVAQVRETEGLVASLAGGARTAAEKPVVRKKVAAKKSVAKKTKKKTARKKAAKKAGRKKASTAKK